MLIRYRVAALATTLCASFILAACNSGGGGGGGGGGNGGGSTGGGGSSGSAAIVSALQVSLEGAQGLLVTGSDGTAATAAGVNGGEFDPDEYLVGVQNEVGLDPDSLYKATVDGRLERVDWTGEDGSDIPPGTIIPKAVTELTDRFVAIGFEQTVEDGETLRLSFLAEKSTGLAYSEDPMTPGPLHLNLFAEPRKITTDRDGNIYLEGLLPGVSQDGIGAVGIYRIDVSAVGSEENVEATLISGDDNYIGFWEIPYDGRFLAYAGSTPEGVSVDRLRRTDAPGFDNSDIELANRMLLGINGEVYAFDNDVEEPRLLRLDLRINNGIPETVLTEMVPPEGAPGIMIPFSVERRIVAGRLIVPAGLTVGRGSSEPFSTPYEVRPEQGYSRPVPELENIFESIRGYTATERFLFFFADTTAAAPGGADDGVIIRWDGTSGDVVRLDVPSTLDLAEFEVLSDSRVWVRAVERATDSTVIGEIDLAGAFVETGRIAGTQQVLVLRPISPAQFIVVDGLASDWPDELILTTDGGDIAALGAIADRGLLKLLVRTAEMPEGGLVLHVDDGMTEFTIKFDPDIAAFAYYTSTNGDQVNAAQEGWIAARGADGFEFAIPTETFTTGAMLSITATLADLNDDDDRVNVEDTGASIGPALYTLP